MSADSAVAVDTGSAAPADTGAPDIIPLGGTVGDIRDALGFDQIEDLAPDPRPDAEEVEAKPNDEPAKAEKPAAKANPDEADETDDVAAVKAIEARSKARRKAKEAERNARLAAQKPANDNAGIQDTPPPAKPAEAKPERVATPVETAVRDVLAQIEALAAGDAAATDNKPANDNADRTALLTQITSKLEELTKGVKASEEGKKQVEELKEQLRDIQNARIVRDHVIRSIDPILDELPKLSDPKSIRKFNKENGTSFADAADMVADAAARYFAKFKAKPDMADLARRIEKKLGGTTAEQRTEEKPAKKSNTVSRSDGSPPAARSGPDERTWQEAEADFKRRFGIE